MVRKKEGTLVVAAFLGRGIAGDEAMFQVFYETFSPRFDIIASVDEHGAYPDFWRWYPYNRVQIAHQTRLDVIEGLENCAGLVIGGGSLSLGFCAGHVLMARVRNVPVALASCDIWTPHELETSPQQQILKLWLCQFDRLILRTERSATDARRMGRDPVHAGDWALRLETDRSSDVTHDEKRALIVLREDSAERLTDNFRGWFEGVVGSIREAGYQPALLPFSPEDERFARDLELPHRMGMIRTWWNARRLKQWIGSSGLTVTIGRLHPMIFAAPTGTKVAAIRMPHWTGPAAGSMIKLADMAKELGIGCYDAAEDFAAALRAGTVGPADAGRVAASMKRADEGLDVLGRMFRDRRERVSPRPAACPSSVAEPVPSMPHDACDRPAAGVIGDAAGLSAPAG